MKILIRILVTAAALAVAAWVVPGIHTEQWTVHGTGAVSNDASIAKTLIIVAIIFGIVNAILKPAIKAVGCAFYILTLGLIAIVVNGLLLLLTSWIAGLLKIPFHVDAFWPGAVVGALFIGVVSWALNRVADVITKRRPTRNVPPPPPQRREPPRPTSYQGYGR